MSRWWISLIFLILAILATGCGKGGMFSDSAPLDVYVDSSVTDDEYNLLAQDFQLLKQVQFVELQDDDYRGIYGMSAVTPENLRGWMGARLRVIVGDSFGGYEQSDDPNLVTNAYNYGADRYINNYGVSITLGDGRVLSDTTPRIGIVKKGPGYFQTKVDSSPINSVFHGLRRLAIMAHECRHDDGNGRNVAMSHAKCPAIARLSKSYWNQSVCEGYRNGPYRVSVATLKHFRQYCARNCNAQELNAFDAMTTDYASRLLETAVYVDPTPEGS